MKYQFVSLEDGNFDITVVYNNDTVLDAYTVNVDSLSIMERAMQHELRPTSITGQPSKTKFSVPGLLELLTQELTARMLVLK